jgi:hypothetical protein
MIEFGHMADLPDAARADVGEPRTADADGAQDEDEDAEASSFDVSNARDMTSPDVAFDARAIEDALADVAFADRSGPPITCPRGPTPPPGTRNACGVERLPVKTGTDPGASMVDHHPQETTVTDLASLPVPAALNMDSGRLLPYEYRTYVLRDIRVTVDKLETDGDFHLVLSDGRSTLIGEVPHPACVGSASPFNCYVPAARTVVTDKLHPTTSRNDPSNVVASVIGVAFFDLPHGQTGVAPNAIELHPILGICFGAGCDPTPR